MYASELDHGGGGGSGGSLAAAAAVYAVDDNWQKKQPASRVLTVTLQMTECN